jgi:hypothetical protein
MKCLKVKYLGLICLEVRNEMFRGKMLRNEMFLDINDPECNVYR